MKEYVLSIPCINGNFLRDTLFFSLRNEYANKFILFTEIF